MNMKIDEELCRKVRPQEAAHLMGVSLRAVYNRIQKYGWKQETDFENRAWIYIPEDYLGALHSVGTPPQGEESTSRFQEVQENFKEALHEGLYRFKLNSNEVPLSFLEAILNKNEEELRSLREALMHSETQRARLEGELKRLEEIERLVVAHQETIQALQGTAEANRLANEALNNERIVINNQLVRYREAEREEKTTQSESTSNTSSKGELSKKKGPSFFGFRLTRG